MQGLNSFQASFSCNGNAMLLLAMQILLQSLTGSAAGHTPPFHNVLQRHIYGWRKSWVNCLTWAIQKQLQEAAIGISLHPGKHPNNRHQGNHSNPHFGNATAWLHAPTMLPLMCGHLAWQKPLLLSAWAWLPSANCRLVSCSRDLMCYPLVSKCTDRSRWSLATVTSGHSHPSILGAIAVVQYQP